MTYSCQIQHEDPELSKLIIIVSKTVIKVCPKISLPTAPEIDDAPLGSKLCKAYAMTSL